MFYGRVPDSSRAIIIATGPSVNAVDMALLRKTSATIIAVNGAVTKVHADIFFTCDPSVKVRALLRSQRPGVKYIAAVPPDYGTPRAAAFSHRANPEQHVVYLRRLTGSGPWKHRPGLSEEHDAVHTGNSAYGALGVAYLMGARRIALLGIDGSGPGYAWDLAGSPGDLTHLDLIFSTALPQLKVRGVEVVNGSPRSTVTCFPRMSPEEALQWIG